MISCLIWEESVKRQLLYCSCATKPDGPLNHMGKVGRLPQTFIFSNRGRKTFRNTTGTFWKISSRQTYISQQSTPTSTRSRINQNYANMRNDLWLVRLILSSTHLSLFLSESNPPHPPSLRPSPSVSDSSLVCCQSSYMSKQAAVHSSRTLLCTQGIPSPVSSPQLALCFCLIRSVAPGLCVYCMHSPPLAPANVAACLC